MSILDQLQGRPLVPFVSNSLLSPLCFGSKGLRCCNQSILVVKLRAVCFITLTSSFDCRSATNSAGVSTFQLSKAIVRGSAWPDKDELLDVLYWGRQILALIVGIFWGFIPLHGFLAILLYVAISTTAGQLYATSFQKVCNFIFSHTLRLRLLLGT